MIWLIKNPSRHLLGWIFWFYHESCGKYQDFISYQIYDRNHVFITKSIIEPKIKLRPSAFRLQASGFGLPTSVFRLQTSDPFHTNQNQ